MSSDPKEKKHTVTPWNVQGKTVITVWSEKYRIAILDSNNGAPINVANAALIVRAVNNHDKLLEALEGLVGRLKWKDCTTFEKYKIETEKNNIAWDKARSAITAAKEGE